ncbi:MAG TPA: polysaccharide deacetylase family protein [Thermomicrobiales bacterium]|nr:polysaccharide deacetylase family protein [Thermomicrobiales bacterium]
MSIIPIVVLLAATFLASLGVVATPGPAAATGPSVVYFPVTGHHVADPFLSTWRKLGGLATFGYPLTEAFTDPDSSLTVQYFERERFEYHPENAGTEWEVLFALLGSWLTEGRAEPVFAPIHVDPPPPDTPERRYFAPTGHYLAYGFKAHWETHGGLRIFGYPISEEFSELNSDTGQVYTVQYFERARFEYHPENAGTPYEVLLGRLGAQRAAILGLDMSPVTRQEGAPDYDESLWAPPPPRAFNISVLMYHHVGDAASRYTIPLWRFEQQLDWLQENGYNAVTLSEVYDAVAGVGTLPSNPVAITFDDGYAEQWGAVQAMNARGMRGTFFILSGASTLAQWQIRAMADAGHEIGSHSISHPDLTTVSDARLWSELVDSRAWLRAVSGQDVDIFAYPYGAWNSRVTATVEAAGYRAAVAAWGGTWWSPEKWWVEPRIEIAGTLTLGEFAGYVYGGAGGFSFQPASGNPLDDGASRIGDDAFDSFSSPDGGRLEGDDYFDLQAAPAPVMPGEGGE